MAAPDPNAYLAVADVAARQAAALRRVGGQFGALAARAQGLIGGTATGLDRRMVQVTHEARTLVQQAASQLEDAAAQARKAAREAQELAEAERRRQQAAQAQSGRR